MSRSQIVRSEVSGKRVRRSRMAILAVALALVAGCGGAAAPAGSGARASTPAGGVGVPTAAGQPTAAGNPTPGQGGQAVITGEDVCKLIPEAAWSTLEAALKLTLAKDAENPCSRATDDSLGTVSVTVEPGRDQIKSMNTICSPAPQKITGIGDEATWCPDLKILTVFANGQSVQVQMSLFGSGTLTDTAVLAAAQAFVSAILPVVPNAGTPGGGNVGDNKACSLLTQQELEAALGEPFDAPTIDERSPIVGGLSCTFERTNAIGSVVTRLYDGTTDYERTRGALTRAVDVPGIGDRAYWEADLTLLSAVCNGKTMDVQIVIVQQTDPAKMRSAGEALAKAACPRA